MESRIATPIEPDLQALFGADDEPLTALEHRARVLFPNTSVILWEGDASTFQFTYVSPYAELLLGYPIQRWTTEATFWADVVIVAEDRDDAIAYCALATTKRCDHIFEYRARASDGRVVWLRDVVKVVMGRGRNRSASAGSCSTSPPRSSA